MRLTSLRNDSNTDADALSSPNFLLPLGEGSLSCDKEERIALPPSITLDSDVRRLCRAIFTSIETSYMLNDWLSGRASLTMKNAELENINAIMRANIPGELKRFTSVDTVEDKNKNALKYMIEMLNTPSHS